jgi:hypothetical protein
VNREIADVPTARGDGTVTVTARSFETLAANYPLPFRAPFSRAKGDHFEYWWHLIQFAFDLPDPNSFPALPALAIDNQRTIVDRYVVAADDLSESAFLAHPTMLNVKVCGSGFGEQITRAFPPNVGSTYHTSEVDGGLEDMECVDDLLNMLRLKVVLGAALTIFAVSVDE